MKNLLILILLLVAIFYATFAQAQTYPRKEIDLDAFVQDLFGFQEDEDTNYDDLYESLFQLYRNPLNLNKAERSNLQSLYILSEFQINSILAHRGKHGKFLSIYELQSVDGFDLETIYKLMPFVAIRDSGLAADTRPLLTRIFSEKNQFVLMKHEFVVQDQKGYFPNSKGETKYLGDKSKMYLRYRTSHTGDFSVGFTLEKDPGEQLTWNPSQKQYLTDFASVHAIFYNKGKFKKIAFGDYQIQVGQSLLLSAGFQVGKGSETTATVRRSSTGIRQYSSVLESGFFRGAAFTYELNKKMEITAFSSFQKIDFRTNENDEEVENNEIDVVSSILNTGFHRTESELANKDKISETILGGHFSYNSSNKDLQLGATVLNTHYASAVNRRVNDYNQFQFNGNNNLNLGVDFSYNWENFNFFGELARSQSGGTAFIGGFVSSLSRTVEMSLLYRNFAKNFHSFYGTPFGETTGTINEKGMYWGVKIKPSKRWIFAAYYDAFSFPWLRSTSDAPTSGNEYLMKLTHKPTRKLKLYAQFRYENKGRNLDKNTTKIDIVVPTIRRNYIFNIDYKVSRLLTLKSRVQFSDFEQISELRTAGKTRGYAIIQDINFDFGKFRLSTRFALFDTDDANTRQYAYEKNVLYAFSIPAYSGVGLRNYFLIRWKVKKKIDLWARYAITSFRNKTVIGAGNEEIRGSVRSQLTTQLRVKF